MNFDHLSSFLSRSGMLEVHNMTKINKNVLHLKTSNNESFILKRHRNKSRIEQQWNLFDQIKSPIIIPFERFPNQKKFIEDSDFFWTLSPYIQGRKLNYKVERDRRASLQSLEAFHEHTSGIKVDNPLTKELFYMRWYRRLHIFKKTDYIFREHNFESLYTDIVQTMEKHLQFVSEFAWVKMEQLARVNGTWIHGDVASHNFIRDQKMVYLIDFDLLLCAPQLYDYIQLGQRFLSYINWDLDKLLSYNMVEEKYLKPWLSSIFVPSDVLREWIHFLYNGSNSSIHDYLSRMEVDWINRKIFLKFAKSMLKLN